jgi:hypothetical protein
MLVPIQLVPGVKRSGREAGHSPPRAEVKNALRYCLHLHYVFMVRCLVKHRDNFTCLFLPFTVAALEICFREVPV